MKLDCPKCAAPLEVSAESVGTEAPTLRDQFAMAALTGLLTNDRLGGIIIDEDVPMDEVPAKLASACLAIADAMVEARKR